MIDSSRLAIGRYFPAETVLHRTDARTKLICSAGLVTVLFLHGAWLHWSGLIAILTLFLSASGIPVSYLTGNARPLIPILALTLLLNGLVTEGRPAWTDAPLTAEGLSRGGNLCLRLAGIVTITTVLSLTTMPLDLADGLTSLFHPLLKLRIPVHEMALTATIALRLIPLIADEAARIRTAQLARGAPTHGQWKRRIKDLVAMLVPLFAASFTRSERLADAMQARGYRGSEGRTRYRVTRLGKVDAFVFATTCLFVAAVCLDVG
jgi:energy-coupling factor transport system permease protein